ncbi:hypothetical protein ESY86_02425 [Subsaximicrobium wynnwilliamsii]|jgi:hypothetical protein|uniref:Uncharacterized protein n=1 Tax=Subsaximicrobium wynnwilliamsii TaxID=291179 RepID=A0A5C6ZLS2_9FLAO|nr:hypothetical protein [Subsaximicrobium wynnwilliamsii]TXD85482.1 hypothetical protein ESY87_00735 [Subsaximicrobium wynnwilliamsii]TXD90835.1 hypothetical protein ESY86_02425 [Subsaximicrobium wynnwilliamsii]TXE05342.1 hypothetical protein ESY88_00735 [Subsaximicrobium wynnwilliamsii]
MKSIYRLFTIGFLSLLFISTTKAQSEPTEYLSVGNKIEFNGENFELKWSSHPSNEYYKQEYLRKDDKLPRHEKMIMVEAVKGNIPAKNVVAGKINELENRKKRNPVVNYEKFENKENNEIILDFVLSDGKSVYEWNIYRYQNQNNESGNYLVLYSYSYRNYISNDKEKIKFLSEIKKLKEELIKKVEEIKLPDVKTE